MVADEERGKEKWHCFDIVLIVFSLGSSHNMGCGGLRDEPLKSFKQNESEVKKVKSFI